MKILIVTPLYEPVWKAGGVVSSLSTLCRATVKLNVHITVYATNASVTDEPLNVPLNQPVDLGGVEVYYFKSTFGSRNFFDSRDLIKKLHDTVKDFDAVYIAAWFMWIGIAAASICHKMRVPFIAGIHGGFSIQTRKKSYIKKFLFRELFLRRALSKASVIRLTSEREKTDAGSWLDGLPLTIIPNPVDPERFYPKSDYRATFRSRYNIPPDAMVLTSITRPDWMKRIDLILESIARTNNWYFISIGDCSSQKGIEWRKQANDLGISKRVIWPGFLFGEDLLAALSSGDIFCMISDSENFGRVVVEAMMCGLPLILSKDVGVWELIKKENFVITVEKSIESLSEALLTLEKKKEMMGADKNHIRKIAMEKFSPEIVARQFIGELNKLVHN